MKKLIKEYRLRPMVMLKGNSGEVPDKHRPTDTGRKGIRHGIDHRNIKTFAPLFDGGS